MVVLNLPPSFSFLPSMHPHPLKKKPIMSVFLIIILLSLLANLKMYLFLSYYIPLHSRPR